MIFFSLVSHAGGEEISIIEVTPGNFLHQGTHVTIEDSNRDDIANIGFIVGDTCVAIIDTGGSIDIGNKLLREIKKVTSKPVCYIINTHIHFDHVLGNAAFREEDVEYIGHELLKDAMAANREFYVEQFATELGQHPSAELIIGPDKTVSKTLTLDLGNKPLLLTAYRKSHTSTDLTIYDVNTKTLWTGDLVFRERLPIIDGSLKGWLKSLDEMSQLDIAYTIPGHGSAGTGWTDVAASQINYLMVLLAETRQAIAEGLFLEDAQETIGKSEKDKWLFFDQYHRGNVSKAFIELEWE